MGDIQREKVQICEQKDNSNWIITPWRNVLPHTFHTEVIESLVAESNSVVNILQLTLRQRGSCRSKWDEGRINRVMNKVKDLKNLSYLHVCLYQRENLIKMRINAVKVSQMPLINMLFDYTMEFATPILTISCYTKFSIIRIFPRITCQCTMRKKKT